MRNIQKILGVIIIGIFIAGVVNASFVQYFNFNEDLVCRTDGACDVGTSALKMGKGYFDDLYTNTLTIDSVASGDIDLNGNNILNIGKAGFGEATPDATLEVVSDGGGDYLMISSVASADGDIFIVDSSGNVGIGTSSPDRKLDILDATNP